IMKLAIFAVLPAFVLTCLDGYDTLIDGRCFKFMERKSGTTYYYDSSVNACAKDGTRLATIKSQEENDQLLAAIRKKTTRPGDYGFFFIGLACDGGKLEGQMDQKLISPISSNHTNVMRMGGIIISTLIKIWVKNREEAVIIYYYSLKCYR
ncbi:hypothetical protein PFISCL1PPCAC_17014, partial [Pristionchus fissidentatus]